MLDRTDDISIAAENWLAQFEGALARPDGSLLKTLFHPDSYWRDVLAVSWNLQTVNGADAILGELQARAGGAAPSGFTIDPDRAAPRRVNRAGTVRWVGSKVCPISCARSKEEAGTIWRPPLWHKQG